MRDNKLQPRKALNKAFLKVKPNRENIETFKNNLIKLLDQTNETESEEFHKNLVSDFLKSTYYSNSPDSFESPTAECGFEPPRRSQMLTVECGVQPLPRKLSGLLL